MIRLTAKVMEFDKPTRNGNIYTREVVEKQLNLLQELIKNRSVLGEIESESVAIRFSNVSHIVTDLRIQDNELLVEVETLNTPKGKILQDLIEQDQIGFYMRGIGSRNDQGVVENFKLITIDAGRREGV